MTEILKQILNKRGYMWNELARLALSDKKKKAFIIRHA